MKNLAVAACVRNEEHYLEEWIEFHLVQGVEHFFIYENGSTDGTRCLLTFYENQGLVTVIDYADVYPVQFKAYNDGLERTRGKFRWVAFIDCDEFLFTTSAFKLGEFLYALPDNVSVLAVHWVLYGSSCRTLRENDLVINRFTKRAENVNPHVKSIVRPDKTISVGKNPHTFRVSEGKIVNENSKLLPEEYALLDNPTAHTIRINHYHLKSYEEYVERKLHNADPGSGVPYSRKRIEEMFVAHDKNELLDLSAIEAAQTVDSFDYLLQRIKNVRVGNPNNLYRCKTGSF